MNDDVALPARMSHRLMTLTRKRADRISLAEVMAVLGERGFGLLLLVFTLPNAVPVPAPPGVSAILAIPLIFVAAQMVLGLDRPRLPARLRRMSVSQERLSQMLNRAGPLLERIENRLRPRHAALTGARAERILGLICLLLALVMSLPIPMGNAPVAWALVVIALGLIERDGVFTVLGLVAGLMALAWNLLLVLAGGKAIAFAAEQVALLL